MTEEEKEAIKDLIDSSYESLLDGTTITSNKAINTILNLIEKLQKENEELKNQEATARRINELLVQRYSNSIPVQKIKDKIEELNKQLEEDLQDEIKVNSNRFIIICQCKSCLQELLGSDE